MAVYLPRVKGLFQQGIRWRTVPFRQNVSVSVDGRFAWFHERLARPPYGELRGCGVARRDADGWRIVHYDKSLAVPNGSVAEMIRLRREHSGAVDEVRKVEAEQRRFDHAAREARRKGERSGIDLSPAAWPETELEALLESGRDWGLPRDPAVGAGVMVVGTAQGLAVRAGIEALLQGGNAMDAACTTALTQIVLNAGATVSFAGILTLVYFEAETGDVHALMAPFATPKEERRPSTIPGRGGEPSGRTALVPGFMKGLEAAHRRFGKLPFASLFGPAIYFAERGIIVEGPLAEWLASRRGVLSRLPETRAVFSNGAGDFVATGDLLRQTALAETLRIVAEKGSDSMYTGDWARKLVAVVQADGGKLAMDDLASYEVVWSEPLRITYHGRVVCSVAEPLIGGRHLLEALNLLELAEPARFGRISESADAFYWLIQCSRVPIYSRNLFAEGMRALYPGAKFESTDRLSKDFAEDLWERMREPGFMRRLQGIRDVPRQEERSGGHSDGVVAIDSAGNLVAMCHTINTDSWGTTGIFVDGVSIPDSANFQQRRMQLAGPGGYVPNEMNPTIVLEDGHPVLGSSAVGRGLHFATLGRLHDILDRGMDPQEALNAPPLLTPNWPAGSDARTMAQQVVPAGRFSPEVLDGLRTMGQDVIELEAFQTHPFRGYWIGVSIDHETGERRGAVTPSFNGEVLAETE